MPTSILTYVIKTVMDELSKTITEDIIGAAALLVAVFHPFVEGKKQPFLVALEDGIWVVAVMLAYFVVRAVVIIWREIGRNSGVREVESVLYSADNHKSRQFVRDNAPKHYRAKLVSMSVLFLAMLVMVLVGVHGIKAAVELKHQSTEPVDRANLHVTGAEIDVHVPAEQDIATVEAQGPKLPEALAVMWLTKGTTPEAYIAMQNIGRNRALAPFVVRTAMIISKPLGPYQEDELFKQRPEWSIGGEFSFGNDWYPGDPPHSIHTHYNMMLSHVQDWKDLIDGTKLFYVVTRSVYDDKDGPLPESVSCRKFSLSPSRGHGLCFTHNN